MQRQAHPILEFDPNREAIIEPRRVLRPLPDMPERCVLCFFQDVIHSVCGDGKARLVYQLSSQMGRNPVYVMEIEGHSVAVTHPGVGGPLAAAFLEQLIALGCRSFIACGGAGVLDSEIAVGHVVVPISAIRDEGTSYHYLAAGQPALASDRAVAAIEAALAHHHIPYIKGMTWTTDAIFRETRARMEARRNDGCLTVEMEAASLFAVATFQGMTFGQLLYGGDDLSGDEWDTRDWANRSSTREKLFRLALEAALRL